MRGGRDLTDDKVMCVEEIRDKGCPRAETNEEILRDDKKEEFSDLHCGIIM